MTDLTTPILSGSRLVFAKNNPPKVIGNAKGWCYTCGSYGHLEGACTMTTLQKFIDSQAWDKNYNLPLTYALNNPWIYMAYAQRNCEADPSSPKIPRANIRAFYSRCIPTSGPSLFYRWPDSRGGQTSMDELVGAAYLSPGIAWGIRNVLRHTGYVFNNQNITSGRLWSLKDWRTFGGMWMGRYVCLPAHLHACQFQVPTRAQQFFWCLGILFSLLNRSKSNCGGRLLSWILVSAQEKLGTKIPWSIKTTINVWKKFVGMSPAECMVTEPKEYPVFAETAPKNW